MEHKADIYRQLRRALPYLSAVMAWRHAQSQIDLNARIRSTGFEWNVVPSIEGKAVWEEQGFTLTARVVIDELGWDMSGVETIGRFQEQCEPGAIKHDRNNARILTWFMPAFPENGQELCRRACSYGSDWGLVGIEVTASRAGVDLGKDSLWAIESDSVEDHFTETAFELANEAIIHANQSLKDLCGCH